MPDTSCTVPYLYGDGIDAGLDFGLQAFLPYAYSGKNNDGGPNEQLVENNIERSIDAFEDDDRDGEDDASDDDSFDDS